MKLSLLLVLTLLSCFCFAQQQKPLNKNLGDSSLSGREFLDECDKKLYYFDRNQDGVADIKYLESPCYSHSDFAWVDRDFDGYFDVKAFYGLGPDYSRVYMEVPKSVKLNSEQEYTRIYGILFKEKNEYIGI